MEIPVSRDGSMRELLRVAYPLILSTASTTIMQFTNRVFLARYTPDALAACVPAGILSFTFLCFFMGMATYTNAFVAQYHGRAKAGSISLIVWQGVWLGLISWLGILLLTPLGLWIISHSGHAPAVKALEKQYFLILNAAGGLPVVNAALASFFTGRGKTKITMLVNVGANILCVLLSWLLIFGAGPVPAMGMRGAAYAFICGTLAATLSYLFLIFSKHNRLRYRTARLVGLHRGMFTRLVRYGAPNGMGFFLDIASFGAFVFLIGGIDEISLAASNIVVAINMLVFMPVIGLGIGTLTLVGRYMGAGKPDISVKVTANAVKLAGGYSLFLGMAFIFFPGAFVNIFGSGGGEEYAQILALSRPLMKVLAFFVFFDALGIIYADAIRGAGDTLFQMTAASLCAWGLFVPGTYYIIHRAGGELIHVWMWGGVYVFTLALVFSLRFRSGRWREMNILAR